MTDNKRVIETATDLFSRYNTITMADVADYIAMSKPYVYKRAANIDDLRDKCLKKAELDYKIHKASPQQIVILVKEMLRNGEYKQAEFTMKQYFK